MLKELVAAILFLLSNLTTSGQNSQFEQVHKGIHKVVVLEVLQTKSYTYLYAEENGSRKWLAMPRIEAREGETYFYRGGNEMRDFKSAQLNRTFESVWFVEGAVNANEMQMDDQGPSSTARNKKEKGNKIEMLIDPVIDGVSIAELYANRMSYSGKIVKVRGMVTQYSASIMGRNWIHLQDGTDHQGDFDLVATSDMEVEEGSVVVLEGIISVDKDFGYGYFYDLIMEQSKVLQ